MRKTLFQFLIFAALLFAVKASLAEAVNFADLCQYEASHRSKPFALLYNKDYAEAWETKLEKSPFLEITAPQAQKIHGLYVQYAEAPTDLSVEAYYEGDWHVVENPSATLLTQYTPIAAAERIKISFMNKSRTAIKINELRIYGEGALPEDVQRWEKTPEKTDLLFVFSEAGSEITQIGTFLPYYVLRRQKSVAFVVFNPITPQAATMFLDSLWNLGLRQYPIIGNFRDTKAHSMSIAYGKWGKGFVRDFLFRAVRQTKPDVIVTSGMYHKNGFDKILADMLPSLFDKFVDPLQNTESAGLYGTWQPKKLYLQEEENYLNIPQDARFDSLVQRSVAIYRPSNRAIGDFVLPHFSLEKTLVGEDKSQNDFLENAEKPIQTVPQKAEPEQTAPAASAKQEYREVLPQGVKPKEEINPPKLNEKGFLNSGEYVYKDAEAGVWKYISTTLHIEIIRKYDSLTPLVWYEAEIFSDVSKGEIFKAIPFSNKRGQKEAVNPALIAQQSQSVFGLNADYYSYRYGSPRPKGIDIRNKTEIIYDDAYPSITHRHPNLDIMALFEDGRMEVYDGFARKAQEFVDMGATDVFSFGPYLIKNGELNKNIYNIRIWDMLNPRIAIGMIKPGHYFVAMCEGRLRDSKGVDLDRLTKIMQSKNCEVAFNLDGGQTAVILFMGEQITRIGKYSGGKTNPRYAMEILGIGKSSQGEKNLLEKYNSNK